MKKISSKIILSLLLAVVLWGGMGVFFTQDTQAARGKFDGLTQEESDAVWDSCPVGGANYSTCVEKELERVRSTKTPEQLAAAGGAQGATITDIPREQSFWSWLTDKAISVVTGPIADTVMMVQGVLLQAIAIPILSALIRISAALLELSVRFTLSSDIFTQTSGGITIIWSLVRDICNITFIFILLWVSIQTIVGVASGKTKKMIADVVIAALLINFSLFITKIVIDVGNILGSNLYNRIVTGAVGPGGVAQAVGLDSIIMQNLGLNGIFGFGTEAATNGVFSVSFGIISYLQIIVLLAGFIVFMYAALLMIGRTAALIFLMAMSPIGFMGNVLPKLAEYSKQWRETLYGMTMMAPVFLIFVYIIVKVAASFSVAPASITDSSTGTTDFLPYFKYVMILVLLIIAVKTTRKMTGAIGAAIEKIGTVVAGAAVGVASGGAAFAGKQVLGRFAAGAITGSERIAQMASDKNKNLATKFGAGLLIKAAEKTSKATFDARNSAVFKQASGLVGEHTGLKVDYDRGISIKKGGFQGMVKERVKEEEEFVKNFEDVKFTEQRLNEERDKVRQEITETKAELARQRAIRDSSADEDEKRKAKAEISKKESKLSNLEAMVDMTSPKNIKDSTRKLEAELQRKLKESYADVAESGIINTVIGANKKAAAAIRKASKGKSADDELLESIKKAAPATETPAPSGTQATTPPATPSTPTPPAA